MKTQKIITILAAFLLCAALGFGQTAMTTTTLSVAVTDTTSATVTLASATNVASGGYIYVDNEAMQVLSSYVSGTLIPVRRGASSTRVATHASSTTVYVVASGNQARSGFRTYSPAGSCTRTNEFILPVLNILTGDTFDCQGSQWGQLLTQYVPPTQCTFAPTTLTTTNTYPQIGASNIFVLNAVSNAAAGTNTLVCNILPPTTYLGQRGAVLVDIVSTIGSQVVAPTSLGTATLGTITFPTPVATTQTASVVTPVTSGTITTLGPTTTVQTVTTAGAFLTFKHTSGTAVILTTDLKLLQFTFPILQSAASAMTLNTAGLFVHYFVPIN